MPSSRPRRSPVTTSPSNRNGPPEELGRLLHLPRRHQAADLAGRDRLPRHLHQRHHARLELVVGAQELRGRPSRPCRSGSSRPPTRARRPAARSAPRCTKSSALCSEKPRSKGITTSSLHPQPGDQVALDRERCASSFGRGLGVDHRQRVRIEGEHGVAAADHLAVAEVHAVEGADGDAARAGAGLDVGEQADLHAGANTTTGWSSSSRGSAIAEQLAVGLEAQRARPRRARAAMPAPVAHRLALGLGRARARAGTRARRRAARAARGRRPRAGTGRSRVRSSSSQ